MNFSFLVTHFPTLTLVFKSLMHNSILKGKRNETIYWGFGRLWSQNEEGGLSGADNALDIYF